jgi:hypothetical protein
MICPFTKETIEYNASYTKRTSKEQNISRDDVKYKLLEYNFPDIAPKIKFHEFYVDKEYSFPKLAREFNLKYFQIQFLIKYHSISSRNHKEAANTTRVRQECTNTCLTKYGVTNVSKCESVKSKKAETFRTNYGVDNIRKSKAYYEWLDSYMIEHYGKKRITGSNQSEIKKEWWANLPADVRKQKIDAILKNLHTGCFSKLETNIAILLDEFGIEYERSFWINKKQFDFKIKNTSILIEVNGDFWHANPIKYKCDDVLRFPNTQGVLASDVWQKDFKKIKMANDLGYKVITVWESDIKSNKHVEILFNEIKKYSKD